MIDILYEKQSKNKIVDKVNEYINNTIDEYIDDDIYLDLVPILSTSDINKDNGFFKSYNISVAEDLNSEEYKTISYLALFYKEKIKYNVKDIIKYLRFCGYKINDDLLTIMCLDKDSEYNCDDSNYISFEEYLTLEYRQKVGNILKETSQNYVDGFDLLFDRGDMK